MNTNLNDKLSLGTKIGFGIGDVFGGGAMVIVGFFYLFFLTDVILISPALAGTAFLISKIWDAISDPLMGIISDRTRTRFGRRRPYFLAGVVLVFLSFTMMWYPIDFAKEIHRFIFVVAAYLFFSTSYTIVMIPYFSLASELTTDYNERTSLTSIRMFFSSVSSLVCAVVPLEIVKMFPSEKAGYITMAIAFGLFFSLPFLVTFFMTKERKEFQKEPEPFNLKKTFLEPLKTPTFINVLFMYLFAMTTMDIIMSIIMYFMTYYIGRANETNYVLGVLLVLQIVALPIYLMLSKKIGKRTSFIIAATFWIVIMLGSSFISPTNHVSIIYIFAALVGLGSGGIVIMIYSILPDVPDVDELYSGKRQEGIYSGLITFMRKASSALGIFMVSIMIAKAGYKKPVEQTIDGVTQLVKQQQTPEFFMALRLIFAVLPVLFLFLAVFSAVKYRLTPEVHSRLDTLLTAKRKGEVYDKNEEAQLKALLQGNH